MEKRQTRRVRATVMTKDDQRDITLLALTGAGGGWKNHKTWSADEF